MKKNLIVFAVAAIGLASCNGGFKQGDGGLLYNIVDDKTTPVIKGGDFISANIITKTDGDSVLYSSYDAGKPVAFPMPAKLPYKGDVYSALLMMSEGDSAVIKINADSLFKKNLPKPPGFKGKYIIYEVKINKVIQKGTLTDQLFAAKIDDYFKGEAAKVKGLEAGKISKYIADNKLNVTKTDSGLYYQITTPGTGAVPNKGDTVVVNYTGRFLNGKVFDTSNKETAQKAKIFNPMQPYQPIHIPVGVGGVIAGWDQGLQLLNKGAKATFVIPSKLAYGERGMQAIGPYTPLTFEVEIINIIHPNPNAPKPVVPVLPGQPAAK
ncbi:FKBP-type peptidyl-prolyl cis-trans isomerase [Mucilaginibacter polytrichastri]|uniref:peptidylprolyl isomerase n=1 Tax=Mucilaginibacter polytrichastri TaxID=1302689 RepID=A0A1Q6A309_9SPHI|nr:FKBP-type peptidyl-prolyl cis-trans isomerase [Mucilaginibacter polytrichastri]OKS88400.1 putative FKBP-type peptidyl-prolyl cis-trans isomerase [Mucilaginibacter polytrichastri]SFT14291.1 FKBP-type peptidyl-prolyl cis-trans isomerase [Mucilaginibacter polytrichastri]